MAGVILVSVCGAVGGCLCQCPRACVGQGVLVPEACFPVVRRAATCAAARGVGSGSALPPGRE